MDKRTAEKADADMARGALAAIQDLLDDGGIPRGTFGDEQVQNLVVLYNQRGDEIKRLRAGLGAATCPFPIPGDDGTVGALGRRDKEAEMDERRIAAMEKAVGDIPTEVLELEGGLVKRLYQLIGVLALADFSAERQDGRLIIYEDWWDAHFRQPMDELNALAVKAQKASH